MLATFLFLCLMIWAMLRQAGHPHDWKLNCSGFFIGLVGLILAIAS
jgi:hypothetical protein